MRDRAPTDRQRWRAHLAVSLLAGVALAAALAVPGLGAQSASAAALSCDPGVIFGISTGGAMDAIDVATGTTTAITSLSPATNGLGVSDGGGHAYAYSSGSLVDYNANTGTTSTVASPDGAITSSIRGAVDPVNGYFYYGSSLSGTSIQVGAYDPATGTKIGKVATITSTLTGTGGDFAFSKAGVMYVLVGTTVERVNETIPGSSGNAALTTTPIATISGISSSPGIAFASSGYLYVTSGANLYKMNPISGAVIGAPVALSGGFAPQDLASCNYPDTISGATAVTERVHPSDQFTVTATGASWTSGNVTSATTSGTATGTQSATVGPLIAVGDGTYTFTQTMASGSAADYSTTYSCTTGAGTVVASGTGTVATFSPPSGSNDITCTFANTPNTADIILSASLGGARSDASDQWVVSVHADSAGGSQLSSSTNATTTGSGSSIGGGTSGDTSVVADRTFALVDGLSSGSASAAGQYGQALTCTDANALQTGLPTDAAFSGSATIVPVPGSDIHCTVETTPNAASIAGAIALADPRYVDTDQFSLVLHADSAAGSTLSTATTTGTGQTVANGTSSAAATAGRTYVFTASATGNASKYVATVTCTDANGYQHGLPAGAAFTGSLAITPVAGAAISCTYTGALHPASLTATAVLGSARFASGDQVTVAVRTGGPSGSVVNDPSAATTGGSGSTVTAGTGTTGPTTLTPGTAYTVTAAASAHAADYAMTLTCTDSNGVQSGLPTAAAFTGSATITPAVGADLHCAVHVALTPAALTVDVTGPSSVAIGTTGTWDVDVANGGGASGTVHVAVQLPPDVAYDGVAGAGFACTASGSVASGQILDCAGPAVAGGATGSFSLTATPQTGTASSVTVAASVDPDGTGTPVAPSTCTGSGTPTIGCDVSGATTIGSGVHLQLDVTGPTTLTVGTDATYHLTVTDTGTGPAGSAAVLVELPASFTLGSVTGATCTRSGQVLTCTEPSAIAAGGGTRTITVIATPTSAASGASAVLRASVDPQGTASPPAPGACTTDDHSTGCAVSTGVAVGTGIDLGVTVTGPATITRTVPATFDVTATNTGTGPAPAATVEVALPAGLTYVSASGATCAQAGQTLTCALTGVPAQGSTGFAVTAVAPASAGGDVAVRAAIDPTGGTSPASAATCSTSAPTCDSATATIHSATLLLAGTANPVAPATAPVSAGDRIRLTYTVTNAGASALDALVVTAPGVGQLTCARTVLAPGTSTTCTAPDSTVTQADVDHGSVDRTAVAEAHATGCTAGCDLVASNIASTSTPVHTVALVTISQQVRLDDANGNGVGDPGESAAFTARVTNTGTMTLHGIVLHSSTVRLTCPKTSLAVGESMTCTGVRTVTADDVHVGAIVNTVYATGTAATSVMSTTAVSSTVSSSAPAGLSRATLATTGSTVVIPLIVGGVLFLLGGLLLLVHLGRRRRGVPEVW